MTTQQASATTDTTSTGAPALGTAVWVAIIVIAALRAGIMIGLWPLAVRPDGGLEQSNMLALAVHGLGAIAVVGFLLARSKAGTLLGLAYTGYSTIALGLNNPRPGLTMIIWVIGVLTLAALITALIRGGLGKAVRPNRAPVVITGIAMAVGAALATVAAALGF